MDSLADLAGTVYQAPVAQSLGEKDFVRILQEPKNALLEQYRAMIETEGATIDPASDASNFSRSVRLIKSKDDLRGHYRRATQCA